MNPLAPSLSPSSHPFNHSLRRAATFWFLSVGIVYCCSPLPLHLVLPLLSVSYRSRAPGSLWSTCSVFPVPSTCHTPVSHLPPLWSFPSRLPSVIAEAPSLPHNCAQCSGRRAITPIASLRIFSLCLRASHFLSPSSPAASPALTTLICFFTQFVPPLPSSWHART